MADYKKKMENTPVTGILSNLKNLKIRSLMDGSYIDCEHDGLYFETGEKKTRIDIREVNQKKVEEKPFYPKQYLGYFYINLYNFQTDKLEPLFSKAKLAGVDFGLYKYSKKFYNDTDVWFSMIHPYLMVSFYKSLNWTAMASWIAEEPVSWDEKVKNFIVSDDVIVLCNFNRVIFSDVGESVNLGLKIESESFNLNFSDRFMILDAASSHQEACNALLSSLGLAERKLTDDRLYLQESVELNSTKKQAIVGFVDKLVLDNPVYTLQYFLEAILF